MSPFHRGDTNSPNGVRVSKMGMWGLKFKRKKLNEGQANAKALEEERASDFTFELLGRFTKRSGWEKDER